MDRIRNMAKRIKRSRHQKRDSLGLAELTQEMDDIIGQIDKIKQPSKSRSKKRRNLKNSQYLSGIRKSTSSQYKAKSKKSTSYKEKGNKFSSQMLSSLSRDQKKAENKYSRLEQQRQARKLKNFKTMMRSGKLQKTRKLYKESSLKETNPLKLTSELDDIFKTITSLEQQEFGNTYHQERQKKLKTLMRSSKLADIRKTMNLRRDDSNLWMREHDDNKSHEDLDKNFTMKKCPKCFLYFPLEKIAKHCRNCKK